MEVPIMEVMETPATPMVSTAAPADVDRAAAVLTLAFAADPFERWKYPDPWQYLTLFPRFVRAFGGGAFAQGTACHTEGYAGVSLWLPPGTGPDEAAIETSLPAEREAELAAIFEQMARFHPHEPHWYLPLIGVDPAHWGKGHGAALLQRTLRRCDQHHVPAYLESTNPANLSLYRYHGFELQGTIQVGSAPPLFPMLRSVR
jgi:GNAT superfamily N-acetyltransferase